MHGEKEEDEERLGGDLGFLRLGRSNGYSSQEPWLIRHPTHRVGMGIEEASRPTHFLSLDSRRALAICADRNVQQGKEDPWAHAASPQAQA